MKDYYIGIDLGGTNVKGVLMAPDGQLVDQHQLPTRDTGDDSWKLQVHAMSEHLITHAPGFVRGIGISAPGLPDRDNTCIAFMPGRLPGLEGFAWSKYLGHPTFVLNDADAALMAEARFGAAEGMQHAVLLTLGTGVGGGVLINGALYQGMAQMAGHFGHISLDAGHPGGNIVGMPGSLEFAIGNYSVEERSYGRYSTTAALVAAYQQGEPLATYVWLHSIQRLAVAIASLANAFSPECVILAGGISLAGAALFKPLETFLSVYEWRPGGKQTAVVPAQFSDMAGAIGAGAFCIDRLKSSNSSL